LAGSTIFVTKYADTVRHENPISAGRNLVGPIRVAFDDGLSSTLERATRSTLPAVARLCYGSLPHTRAVRGALRAVSTTDAGLPTVSTSDADVSALPAAHSGLRADLCAAR
jgi:hypothetical protein